MADLRARRSVPPQLADFARRRLAAACPPRLGWVPGADPVGEAPADAGPAAASGAPAREAPGPVPLPVGEALRMSGRAAFGLAVVAVLALTLGASYLLRSRPQQPVPDARPVLVFATPSASATPSAAVVVHVAGLVRRPGLRTLPAGARVADALRAGGGVARGADVTALNLARPLVDGEQVLVSKKGAAMPAAASAPSPAPGAGAGGAVIDLNAATLEQLQQLPGVGPVLAGRIAQWRQEHGRFTTVEELREVSGIGERKYAELSTRVRV